MCRGIAVGGRGQPVATRSRGAQFRTRARTCAWPPGCGWCARARVCACACRRRPTCSLLWVGRVKPARQVRHVAESEGGSGACLLSGWAGRTRTRVQSGHARAPAAPGPCFPQIFCTAECNGSERIQPGWVQTGVPSALHFCLWRGLESTCMHAYGPYGSAARWYAQMQVFRHHGSHPPYIHA